jgi:serine/threonine protein kinase
LQGGDLCQALKHDDELVWYKNGHLIALDIVRGLHFLHSNGVRTTTCCLQNLDTVVLLAFWRQLSSLDMALSTFQLEVGAASCRKRLKVLLCLQVLHGDLKSSNVVLNACHNCAKVSPEGPLFVPLLALGKSHMCGSPSCRRSAEACNAAARALRSACCHHFTSSGDAMLFVLGRSVMWASPSC